MSCGPCEEKKRTEKGMTRGEFIGVGAAAAAGVGTVGMAAGSGEAQTVCTKPHLCGPNAAKTWEVSASVVQVIWGELFPRLVADAWAGGWDAPFATGDITTQLRAHISTYTNSLIPSVYPDQTAFDASPFGKHTNKVLAYLPTSADSTKIPVRFLGVGGFDFILSDFGLDLFSPAPPANAAELLRYYQYRRVGRSAIGIPSYLDEADALAFDVQSPTGPSQVWTDGRAAGTVIGGTGKGCTLGDLTCLDDVAPDTFPRIDPELRERRRLPREPFEPTRSLTIQGFRVAASKVRCWQLEGSVYRGILEQLPRVVATIWREWHTQCFADPRTYFQRWFNNQIRGIFMERLETHLPSATEMYFGARPGTDVMITNQGITFPQLDNPASASDDTTPGLVRLPDLGAMLDSIREGRAGNPVFTDTRRPPRDE